MENFMKILQHCKCKRSDAIYNTIKIVNAKIVDTQSMNVVSGEIIISNGIIKRVGKKIDQKAEKTIDARGMYLIPGFIDAHVHIESSLLTPTEFSKAVLKHGTTTVIADSHEICNILGIKGLELFLNESENLPLEFYFVVPSCVPATDLGTSGATVTAEEIKKMMKNKRIVGLGEVMDFPAVIKRNKRIMEKINAAGKKVVNGHAPGLRGKLMNKYYDAGIMDDHESLEYSEMVEKAEYGVMLFLREGSAEVSGKEQYRIIDAYPDHICFCSDDKSVVDIDRYGSILFNVNKAIALGYDPLITIRCATHSCAGYYGLDDIGNIKQGLKANFFLSKSLKKIKPNIVFVNGIEVYPKGHVSNRGKFTYPAYAKSTVKHEPINKKDIAIPTKHLGNIIVAKDGSLHTGWKKLKITEEYDVKKGILKIIVIERYRKNGNISTGQITGFGIKNGAIGSTVAHDCHNIIVVGTSDDEIVKVANELIRNGGGLAIYSRTTGLGLLKLPIAGIMTQDDYKKVGKILEDLKKKAKAIGCKMREPFGTLSFMALEVIPELKITDKGLVDVKNFRIL
ncbi:adenine deaminase [Candidatus Micrarchaeota archaeon]|nr:adenine deaminase [Candidatus Micrarchaeota archaeon]